ncbi:MAG TPA: nickel transporter [Usitatibacter sp.]|nr:nickel transporter [Usitatibacter sp.]
MDALPTQGLALAAIVFLLGLKHGLDPDHLAAIDGLTRFNAGRRPLLARWSGLLFSAGHGVVVTLVAVTMATVAAQWRVPAWLDDAGTWISVGFLVLLGIANLSAVLRTPRGEMVRPVGLRSRFFRRLTRVDHPVLVAAVGAAFALSFDTFSQAALFSLTATRVAGWILAAGLGLTFTAGMMATDGLNGLWVNHLVRAADRRAAASRVMSVAIAFVALAIAALVAARRVLPAFDQRMASWDLALGPAVVAAVAASYVLALWVARRASWNRA